MSIDVGTVTAVTVAGTAVVGVYLTVRTGIRRDHRDQKAADAAAVKKQITEAIEAERIRVELETARNKIRELENRDD